jgi:hypothetical protein
MKTSCTNNVLTITAEKHEDRLALSVLAKIAEEMAYLAELSDCRVAAAQAKMHKATIELAEFISEQTPNKSLVSRIISRIRRVE